MAEALRTLGVGIEETASSSSAGPAARPGGGEAWRIIPAGLHGPATIDVGNAGDGHALPPPVAALADGPIRFDGDPRSYERPLGGVIDALRALGARIDDDNRGALPMTVFGSGALDGGPVEIDASSSSQFVSALLLSAPRFNQGVEVRHVGAALPSMPHIRMTVDMLRSVGAQVDTPEAGGEPNVWRVTPAPCSAAIWSSSRTCPTPSLSWRRRWSPAAGSPSRTGPSTPPSPATRCARSSPPWAVPAS